MNVGNIMTRYPWTVNMDRTLKEMETMMRKYKIAHLPVVDEGHVVGIVSDHDIKAHRSSRAGTSAADRRDNFTLNLKAFQIMTREVIKVSEDTPIAEAIEEMLKRRIHALPVLSPEGKVMGIVSIFDVAKFCLKTHL